MTWDEAMDAFMTQVIGAMDHNQHCIYHDTPEHFIQGGTLHGADERSLSKLAERHEQPSAQVSAGRW